MLADWQCVAPNRFQEILITSFSTELPALRTTFRLAILGDSERAPTQLLKRSRLRADVDGEGSENMQRKKRRLRLHLITSRLSKPYATPPTHINSKNAVRVGVWQRQRVLGQDLLRRAAILNTIRLKKIAAKEAQQRSTQVANSSSLYDNLNELKINSLADCGRPYQPTRLLGFSAQQFIPPPPSPLGLSNYDAFDLEDDLDEEAGEIEVEVGVEGSDSIYSDFSVLDPAGSDIEDYDSLRPFGDNGNERELVTELGEDVIGLIIENEKQNEVEIAVRCP